MRSKLYSSNLFIVIIGSILLFQSIPQVSSFFGRRSLSSSSSSSSSSSILRRKASTIIQSTIFDESVTTTPIPTNGLIDYIGSIPYTDITASYSNDSFINFLPHTSTSLFSTRWNLWKQLPWKKIKGKVILKATISGSLSIEPGQLPNPLFSKSSPKVLEVIPSLHDLMNLFIYGAHDPRVEGILIDLGGLSCGYAKLQELRQYINYFKQSGKPVIGFSNGASEKEYFIASSFTEFYIPPEGTLDLRGLSSTASFVRGALEKVGIEPQVQRIGKYKSAGDQLNREQISDAQREVISSLLSETAKTWCKTIAEARNLTSDEVLRLWVEEANEHDPYECSRRGLITAVLYEDQVETYLKYRLRKVRKNLFTSWIHPDASLETSHFPKANISDFNMTYHFEAIPRRNLNTPSSSNTRAGDSGEEHSSTFLQRMFPLNYDQPNIFPAASYLRKMRKAPRILKHLPYIETSFGPRIAVINAAGAINTGDSRGNSPLSGQSIGSDSIISQIREARDDDRIRAVVLRVDSPGGSALASDLIWRELRMLSKAKPVVACMVDLAASGGYYLSMACDVIVADQLTLTGSIGVVLAKFNIGGLNERLGLKSETLSIGKYAEVLSSSRSFTEEEAKYFEELARKAYLSFVSKAAASRNMTVEAMQEVAQGRVWTGRQALDRGLVDQIGGLWKAVEIASNLSDQTSSSSRKKFGRSLKKAPIRLQIFRQPMRGLGALLSPNAAVNSDKHKENIQAMCGEEVVWSGLIGPDALGMSPALHSLGISPALAAALKGPLVEAGQLLLKSTAQDLKAWNGPINWRVELMTLLDELI